MQLGHSTPASQELMEKKSARSLYHIFLTGSTGQRENIEVVVGETSPYRTEANPKGTSGEATRPQGGRLKTKPII